MLQVNNVPRITTHEDALRRYKNTKPIRGVSPERRPLAERRYHGSFWIRIAENMEMPGKPTVEFMCYRTPVVTFLPDDEGTVEIRTAGYTSATTHAFIWNVLGIGADGFMGKTRLTVGEDVMLVDSKDAVVRLRKNKETGKFEFVGDVPELFQPRMNRKAANNVRRKYREFADYLAGFVKLRTVEEPSPHQYYAARGVMVREIRTTIGELADALGIRAQGEPPVAQKMFIKALDNLGRAAGGRWYNKNVAGGRLQQEAQFLAWIDPAQSEETKTEGFYKAALALMLGDRSYLGTDNNRDSVVGANPEIVMAHYDKSLMMAHAKEVLAITKLPRGKTPSRTYDGWLIESEGEKA